MISYYAKRGNETERRAHLLRGSLSDVERLERAAAAGWDVAEELRIARAQVEAFSTRKDDQ